jgi:hypothetical protein
MLPASSMLRLAARGAQLGHQAVNCTNGTINWRQIYGDEAFKLKPAIFPSDVDRAKKEKQVDIDALEKQAREFVRVRARSPRSTGRLERRSSPELAAGACCWE